MRSADFSAWLADVQRALRGEADAVVPCDGCTACCTASQFVHIEPDETDALSHIPAELLFPAPGRPRGHVVLGYDERGHCPMLVDGKCSIYEHRPRTCRTYDCRVFAGAGLVPESNAIAERVREWRFNPSREQEAVRAAARFLREHGDMVRTAGLATSPAQLAVLSIELHELFMSADEPEPGAVRQGLEKIGERTD